MSSNIEGIFLSSRNLSKNIRKKDAHEEPEILAHALFNKIFWFNGNIYVECPTQFKVLILCNSSKTNFLSVPLLVKITIRNRLKILSDAISIL